jgi:hypothetical protein
VAPAVTVLRPETCAECRRAVLWVKWEGRPGLVALDTCRAGAGDVGIQVGLLGVEPRAVRVAGGASYREHRCPKAAKKTGLSFTGGAPAGKRRT